MTVLVDSWAWIEYFRGSKAGLRVEENLKALDEIIISTINIAEVYRYMLANVTLTQAKEALQFILKRSFVIPVTIPIATMAAELRHEKKTGLGDSIVMATGRKHDAKILTGDPDFKNESNVIFLE